MVRILRGTPRSTVNCQPHTVGRRSVGPRFRPTGVLRFFLPPSQRPLETLTRNESLAKNQNLENSTTRTHSLSLSSPYLLTHPLFSQQRPHEHPWRTHCCLARPRLCRWSITFPVGLFPRAFARAFQTSQRGPYPCLSLALRDSRIESDIAIGVPSHARALQAVTNWRIERRVWRVRTSCRPDRPCAAASPRCWHDVLRQMQRKPSKTG